MSYILDALQRAEDERARGSVPTLHTRPPAGAAATPALITPKRLALAALGLAVMLIAAALAWWLWGSSAPPSPAVSANANPPAVLAAPTTAPETTAPHAPTAPATPAPVVSVAPAPAAPAPTEIPEQPPKLAPSAAPSVAPAPQPIALPQAAATPAPKPQAASPIAAPTPSSTLVPLLSALPEDIRRQIPPLSITGTIYSADPAQRLLLMNGQVFNEGSQITPELSLLEIRANSAEFNFQGTRFRIAR